MKKILFWPYQLYVWLVFFPLAGILTVLFSMLTIIFAALVNPHFASRVFAVTWAKWLAWLTPIRVEVEGADNAERHRSYVVASNHQSMYDILVIYGWLDLDLKWVMKAELRKMPAIGIGCEKAGHIFVDRGNHARAANVPMIVAINKIDKANAEPDRVRQQLAERELLLEDWGGDVQSVEVSAKNNQGLDDLLEMILLVAEMKTQATKPLPA